MTTTHTSVADARQERRQGKPVTFPTHPLKAALDAAADVADAREIPVTLRDIGALLDAALPHLTGYVPTHANELAAYPYQRLLHSLIAAGWTKRALAARMGMDESSLGKILCNRCIMQQVATRIEHLFADLYGLNPAEHGVHPRGVTRALNDAARNGWTVIPAAESDLIRSSLQQAAQEGVRRTAPSPA